MATYKVIQDIEAEDKFVGPLTLKQFIFASAGVAFGWLSFLALTKGAVWALAIFLPPMLFAFFLAIPWSKEQPTEIWALAKLRFRLKPKVRIWNQDGLQELVTITVPKKVERQLTDTLSETEVTSRLKALADTIDTRGWAVKNAQVNMAMTEDTSDRLVSPTILPQQVDSIDVSSVEDMMDDNNAVSTNFDQMIHASDQIHREQTINKMDRVRRGEPINPPKPAPIYSPAPDPILAQPDAKPAPAAPEPVSLMPPVDLSTDETTLAQQLRERQASSVNPYGHLRDLRARPAQAPATPDPAQAQADMTTPSTLAIIDRYSRNNDLNIETVGREIARETKKASEDNDGEVVINLH